MRPFVIEIYWPDMTKQLAAELASRAMDAAADDSTIRYAACEVTPRDETCFLRVMAADDRTVQKFADALGLEGARVSEIVDVPSSPRLHGGSSAIQGDP